MKKILFLLLLLHVNCAIAQTSHVYSRLDIPSNERAAYIASELFDTIRQSEPCDSLAFYRSEYKRLRVKVQLAQQNLLWMDRFVNIVAVNPSQAKFVKGWANRVKAAKLYETKKK